jgi:hypothetical protein
VHRFDPQQRQTAPVAARPHFTDLASIHGYDSARERGRALDPDRHQPLLDEPAIRKMGALA